MLIEPSQMQMTDFTHYKNNQTVIDNTSLIFHIKEQQRL